MTRHLILILLVLTFLNPARAQTGTGGVKNASSYPPAENLFLLGKIWGLLKYYHPQVTAGKFNWDDELKKEIAVFRQPMSLTERNDSMLAWLKRVGEVKPCDTCSGRSGIQPERSPDFSWFTGFGFNDTLSATLKQISSAIPASSRYIKYMVDGEMAFPMFQNEARYPGLVFPDSVYGLVALFRYWNAVQYGYPYKHLTGESWDSVLKRFIPRMGQLSNRNEYLTCAEELAAVLHDGHGYVYASQYENIHGKYILPLTVAYIRDQWVITSLLNDSLNRETGIRAGDILESVNDISMKQRNKELLPYCGAATPAAQQVRMAGLITRVNEKNCRLAVNRAGKKIVIGMTAFQPSLTNPPDLFPGWFTHQRDSAFYFVKPGILYVNVGVLNRNDSLLFFEKMGKAKSVIVDMRQNQDEQKGTGAGDLLCRQLVPEQAKFVKLLCVVPEQPGAFRFTSPTDLGIEGKGLFKGPVAVLINEQVTSVGEMITQALKTSKQARFFGTPTSGTDGNMTYLALPGNIMMSFTGLGTYFPDGTQTQRIGIRPDVTVKPTVRGFAQGRDEVLEKALSWLQTKR